MSTAAILANERFRQVLDAERAKPVQRNLFTGEPESVRIDIPEFLPDDETILDEGISVVKTDDLAQLIVSGYGLYLGKKSERLVVRKDKNILYQFPFFRIQEVVVASKGISLSGTARCAAVRTICPVPLRQLGWPQVSPGRYRPCRTGTEVAPLSLCGVP